MNNLIYIIRYNTPIICIKLIFFGDDNGVGFLFFDPHLTLASRHFFFSARPNGYQSVIALPITLEFFYIYNLLQVYLNYIIDKTHKILFLKWSPNIIKPS